jgi:3-hydroxybutyryl-CoA dehydratase
MLKAGDVLTYERTFSEADVRLFAELSGDKGLHHVQPDEQGRLMVQGLLTATVPTKIGGDLNFIARSMEMEFLRPVFTGDTIRCVAKIESLVRDTNGAISALLITSECYNQHGKLVLRGRAQGLIRNERPPA